MTGPCCNADDAVWFAAPSPVGTTEPGVAVCFCRDGVIPHEPGSEGCRDTTEPPAETQQDEGRLDEAAGLIAHNVSPAIGWWRSADAKGEQLDREKLTERYRRAARDVLALAARPSADTETVVRRILNTVDPLGSGVEVRQQCIAVVRAALDAR